MDNIKESIVLKKIKQWEIAEIIGISEFTLSRWLRNPEKLNNEKLEKVKDAINQLTLKGA
jgi:DNA-binding LacI/PurR family transcriptional regulator